MSPTNRVLCVISEDQQQEYADEFAKLGKLDADLLFERSPEQAFSTVGSINPAMVIVGTEVGPFEGIEFLAMLISKYPEYNRPVVVLPEKEDDLPPMIHCRGADSGHSSVENANFDTIAKLITRAPTPLPDSPIPPSRSPKMPFKNAAPAAEVLKFSSPPLAEPEARPESDDSFPNYDLSGDVTIPKIPSLELSEQTEEPTGNKKPFVLIAAVIAVVVLAVVGFFAFLGGDEEQATKTASAAHPDPVEKEEPAASKAAMLPAEVAQEAEAKGEAVAVAEEKPDDKAEEPEAALAPLGEAPEEEKAAEDLSGNQIVLPLTFGQSKYIPIITDKAKMNSIVEKLRQSDAQIELTGHASSDGETAHNFDIAIYRAKNVMTLLIRRGISPERFKVTSLGSTSPIESNETPQGRAKNRRVMLRLIP